MFIVQTSHHPIKKAFRARCILFVLHSALSTDATVEEVVGFPDSSTSMTCTIFAGRQPDHVDWFSVNGASDESHTSHTETFTAIDSKVDYPVILLLFPTHAYSFLYYKNFKNPALIYNLSDYKRVDVEQTRGGRLQGILL